MDPTQSIEWREEADAGRSGHVTAGGHVADGDVGDLVIDELLVEEISIDGMCGVY